MFFLVSVFGREGECFPDTPRGFYETLWRDLGSLHTRLENAADRRAKRLQGTGQLVAQADEDTSTTAEPSDVGNICDPDGYGGVSQRRPYGHKTATNHAEEVMIDRVRTALELHYDAVFKEDWMRRHLKDEEEMAAPARPQRYRLMRRVQEHHRAKRFGVLEIPAEIRSILRSPANEKQWSVLQKVADVLCKLVCGAREVQLHSLAEVRQLANQLQGSVLSSDLVVVHGRLSQGSMVMKILTRTSGASRGPKRKEGPCTAPELLAQSDSLPVGLLLHEHPREGGHAMRLSNFGEALLAAKNVGRSLRDLAQEVLGENTASSPAAVLGSPYTFPYS